MAKIKWGVEGTKLYETGVSNVVLYVYNTQTNAYNNGVGWDGVTSAKITPEGGEETDLYADNTKYAGLTGSVKVKAGIEAYMYPDEWVECDGTADIGGVEVGQQVRSKFGFTFRSEIGSDTAGLKKGYKIWVVYGCSAAVSERSYSTINDSPEAVTLSYDISTTPQEVGNDKSGRKLENSSYVCFNSLKISPENMKKIEDKLYGTESSEPTLPPLKELIALAQAG